MEETTQNFSFPCPHGTKENCLSYDFLGKHFDDWLNELENNIRHSPKPPFYPNQSAEFKEDIQNFKTTETGELLRLFLTLYDIKQKETDSYKIALKNIVSLLKYQNLFQIEVSREIGFCKKMDSAQTSFAVMEAILNDFHVPSTEGDYGGRIGRLIYSAVMEKKIIPFIDSFFSKSEKSLVNNSSDDDYKNIIRELLRSLGQERAFIAKLGGYENETFGEFFDGKGHFLEDFVTNTKKWQAWHDHIIKMITERIVSSSSFYYLPGYYPYLYIELKGDKTSFIDVFGMQDNEGFRPTCLEVRKKIDERSPVILYKISLAGTNLGDMKKIDEMIDTDEKRKKLAESILKEDYTIKKLPNIRCWHFPYVEDFVVTKTLSDFKSLFQMKKATPDSLIEPIAHILWEFSHSSTFLRGQAAITDWILKGIARWKGYSLFFNMDLPADQQALSDIHQEVFLSNCRANNWIVLEKI